MLPKPRSTPVLGRGNVKIPANEALYPSPTDLFSPPLPLGSTPVTSF